jgi:hypothetical protein
MEYVDFFVIAAGCVILFEGARRLDMVSHASKLREKITNRSEEGIPDNCLSYKIMNRPSEESKWNLGLESEINARPMLIFVLVILTLAAFFTILMYSASYPRIVFFILTIVFALALHSGPDHISNNELYLRIIGKQDPEKLNGHDLKFLTKNIKDYRDWPLFQVIFGILFISIFLWPDWFFFIGVGIILLLGFIFLGSKYSIQKGIFESEI